jgi:Na+/citrate or Na+/malate symporter
MIGLPPVELAAIFDLSATTLAAFAVFAGLYLAIIGSSDPKVAKVPGAALFLVLFGTAVFVFGRAVKYHFAGY